MISGGPQSAPSPSAEWLLTAALPRELLRSLKNKVSGGDRVQDASLLIAPACSYR